MVKVSWTEHKTTEEVPWYIEGERGKISDDNTRRETEKVD